jgi:hypothetical protein
VNAGQDEDSKVPDLLVVMPQHLLEKSDELHFVGHEHIFLAEVISNLTKVVCEVFCYFYCRVVLEIKERQNLWNEVFVN